MPTITELHAQNGGAQLRAPQNLAPLTATRNVAAPNASRTAGKAVAVCDTQPVTAEGVRNMLDGTGDLRFLTAAASLEQALETGRLQSPDVLLIDKAFGIQAILDWLGQAVAALPGTGVVIWGVAVTEAEALRFLQAGARGILRKTAALSVIVACLLFSCALPGPRPG